MNDQTAPIPKNLAPQSCGHFEGWEREDYAVMKTFKERLERIEVEEPVHIPTLDGIGIAKTIAVKVPAWRDPKEGEIYLDTEATAILDKIKARHMGLLPPDQLKALRKRLDLTQPQISELLQIGEKTWTRWETGRERPSRSLNVLLGALNDGKLDVAYLRSMARRRNKSVSSMDETPYAPVNPRLI
jgi:DNA-binding transcriptional regulator YiaG